MLQSWESLLGNLAIIAIVVSICSQIKDPADSDGRRLRTLFLSVLAAGGTIAVMASQFEIRPGILADLRVTVIVISGFFGGPFVGIAAAIAGAGYRLWLGGLGAPPAIFSISVALAVGLTGRWMLGGRVARRVEVLALSMAAAIASMVGFLLLPGEVRASLFPEIPLAVASLTVVSTLISGLALSGDQKRREIERQNTLYATIIDTLPDPLNAKDVAGRFLRLIPPRPR